jgi:predicted transcriptional regulator
MVDIEKLKKTIKDSGMTMVAVSQKSGITRETLYNRMNGIGDFTATEIIGLSKALNLKKSERENIFFKTKV